MGDRYRRTIIVEMLKSGITLSIPQLGKRSGIPYSTTFDIVDSFVKSGLCRRITVAKYRARQDSNYELTDAGIAVALALSEDQVIGTKRTTLLQRIFQPSPESDAISVFTCYVMLNAIDRGLEDYVLRYIRKVIELNESSPESLILHKAVEGVTDALLAEVKPLSECVMAALNTLSDSDRETVVQYYRNQLVQELFNYSMMSHDRKLQELARMSQMDQEGIYTQFSCKCGFLNENLYVKMEDLLIRIFTGRWKCPKCNRTVSERKKRTNIIRHINQNATELFQKERRELIL